MKYPGDKFTSMDVYLRASSWDKKIVGYDASSHYWRDLGSQTELFLAEKDAKKGLIALKKIGHPL